MTRAMDKAEAARAVHEMLFGTPPEPGEFGLHWEKARHRREAEAKHAAEVEALCRELDRDPEVQRLRALYRTNPEALFEDMRRWNEAVSGTGVQWFGAEIEDEDFEEDEDENDTP